MLILTRRVGESLVIGDSIRIVVCEIKGNQVRIGIQAPRDTTVDRAEVHARKQGEHQRRLSQDDKGSSS